MRAWTIDESTGSRATREGFCLVPDFASTAFMIQGYTLDAELADCGDTMTQFGTTEMVTAYVILSRVRSAATLLLMQVFSQDLFRLGSPPGPACLMKLLRRRLTEEDPLVVEHTSEQAIAGYTVLAKRWEDEKQKRKVAGQEWQCFDCQFFYPSDGSGVDLHKIHDVHAPSIKPGHWRRCIA